MPIKTLIQNLLKKLRQDSVFRNVVIVAATTIIVRAAGFFKEVVIANSFGLTELLDTFLIAFLIPSFIISVFMGAFTSVFITNYIIESKTSKNIGAFQTSCFIITVLSAIIFFLVSMLVTDVYVEFFFKGHSESYYDLVKIQFYYLAPSILISGFSSLVGGLLNINDEFFLTTISTLFIPVTIIICLVFFHEAMGVLVLALSTTIGSLLKFIFQLSIALKRKIIVLSKPDFKSENIRIMYGQIPAKLTSGFLSGINPVVDQYFSAQLIVGSIAALNFGIKVPAFLTAIVGLAIGKVLLPHFSKTAIISVQNTYANMKSIINKIIMATIVVVVLVVVFSTPIVKLIFEGNQFSSADSLVVSKIQQMYILQMPFYLSSLVIVNFLISINRNNFLAIASVINFVLNIILNIYLMRIMDVYGLALSTSVVSTVNFIVLYIYVKNLKKKGFNL